MSLALGLLFGLLLGMRHAVEPDHLAAVSTLVEARPAGSTAVLGAFWGIGHSLSLLAVGCVLAAFQARLPGPASAAFEVLVAVMLVGLGLRAVRRAGQSRATGPAPPHRAHGRVGRWPVAWRPLFVGIVHGLAGSGALTALVMAELPTFGTRLAYIALFGAGSIAGMAFLTGIAGWHVRRIGRSARTARGLALVTGTVSMGLGTWWGWTAVASLLSA